MADPPLSQPLANAVSGLHIGASADPSTSRSSHGSPSDPIPPPTTPPANERRTFPQHHPFTFHSTPIRPSLNNWVIARQTGRARRLGLVDDTGMGTHFHQLGIQTFHARIPGPSPTASDRDGFIKPDIDRTEMSERAIGIELAKTIKSVLQAAGTSGLRVLHTPTHKGKGDHSKQSDTINDIGIYLDTEVVRRTTILTDEDALKSKLTKEELASGDFGRRSWYSMAALGEVKSLNNGECAFYMRPKSSSSSDVPLEEDNTEVADGGSEEPQPSSTTDAPHSGMDDNADAFADEAGPLDPSADDVDGKPYIRRAAKGEFALGQLGDYMHNLSTHQHRLFSYGFYVQWRWARLLYFDRTGALISEPFDWTETSSPLHDFVWKLAHMTREQLGYDPTAQEASYDEIKQVIKKATDSSLPKDLQPYVKDAFLSKAKAKKRKGSAEDALECDPDEAPIYRLTVTSSDPSPDEAFPDSKLNPPPVGGQRTSERTFLVGRPHFVADSLIGRCTRGYIAFDLVTEQFCFLKDSWRPLVPGRTRPEHLVYERLHSCGVVRIATLVCGGDVGGPLQQPTVTHDCFPERKRPVPRVHYRIVIKEIGLPLVEFADFGELNRVFLDAMAAHYTAWEKAGILHRDVSVGNILIDPVTRRGYLIDWDLSRLRSELEHGPVEPDRTGTWQFRSALSLMFPRKPYRLSDDIESFVHTYRWLVLRFHETDVSGLRTFVQGEYEQSAKAGIPGIRIGGQHKLQLFAAPTPPFQVTDNDGLQKLLDDLAYNCFKHYQMIDKKLMTALYGIPKNSSQQTRQPAPAPAEEERDRPDDLMDVFGSIVGEEPAPAALSPPTPPEPVPIVPHPHQATSPTADPCDVDGFLSKHGPLVKVFLKRKSNAAPRQDDQFHLHFSDEPPDLVLNVGPRGISTLSRSQTLDSNQHFPPGRQAVVSPAATSQKASAGPDPSSATSSSSAVQRNKRRQDDDSDDDSEAPAPEADSNSESPTRVQVPKRQKNTMTQ
ncbi:hypothetical protein LXA43DRAFT_1009763 [Ganoderma leucocontextum]|nr:hypothetical protein LXA43DRAFT_1009763 [Ganoderma leucocontextum]